MSKPIRRNIAHLTQAEREHFVDVIRQVDLLTYAADGVSYWDKQDQIHQHTHNHGGNSFIPWHRELCNRFEALLQQVDPNIALHYWDWTQDPRAADNGQGGTVDLMTSTLFGTSNGLVDGPLTPLHNGDVFQGSREQTGSWQDPPRAIKRFLLAGAPSVPSDASIIASTNGIAQAQQWSTIRSQIESAHNTAHNYFGIGSDIRDGHEAFEDPFVFLLHANVDRLFAMWQTVPGQGWRLDPDLVYGDQSNTADSEGILHSFQPWDGTVEIGSPLPPWTGGSSAIEVKNARHPSVVRPPCYDTLPVTVTQVAPTPGQPIRFLDVVENFQTARALRLRVRGCPEITAQASVTGPFSLLASTVTSPAADGFGSRDLLVWVLHTPAAAPSTANGTLTVNVPATGDTFTVPIQANSVANPTVATSLVLDSSGSMDLPSGVPNDTRMEVLKEAAPLFVHLLNDNDGVGVVAFDTDATERMAVTAAGPQIGGAGRTGAFTAIGNHNTNPAGLTAIGDGLEAAQTQLTPVAGSYDHTATVVFTDGHETAQKTIAQVAAAINSRVFAIGLGTADQLNPAALSSIANGTGGYLLLTGNPGPDDTTLLQKYFAQVLAGVTNSAIVVDPDGFVPAGGDAVVPVELSAADLRADIVVLSPAAEALDVVVEAPDGTVLADGSGAVGVLGPSYRLLRLDLPGPADPRSLPGTWLVRLRVEDDRLRKWLSELEEFGRKDDIARAAAHGVPFTLSVQAQSSLRLGVEVVQASRLPGSTAQLTATLTHSSIPLANRAAVTATVTAPDGSETRIRLSEVEEGVFQAGVPTAAAGVYRVLVRARGTDLGGGTFTREELRTVPVWWRGDDPVVAVADPGGREKGFADLCKLVACWLSSDGIARTLERNEIDPGELLECLERYCR